MTRIKREPKPVRNVRVENETWDRAMDRAHGEGKDLAEVIREFLKRYGKRTA